jgi:hypothetical protein
VKFAPPLPSTDQVVADADPTNHKNKIAAQTITIPKFLSTFYVPLNTHPNFIAGIPPLYFLVVIAFL